MCHSWISEERRNISPGNHSLRKFDVLEETQALPLELSWHINIQCPTTVDSQVYYGVCALQRTKRGVYRNVLYPSLYSLKPVQV